MGTRHPPWVGTGPGRAVGQDDATTPPFSLLLSFILGLREETAPRELGMEKATRERWPVTSILGGPRLGRMRPWAGWKGGVTWLPPPPPQSPLRGGP